MASQDKITRGLQILNEYKPDGETWDCHGEHEVLYATGPSPEDLKGDDAKVLAELGWTFEAQFDSWHVFT